MDLLVRRDTQLGFFSRDQADESAHINATRCGYLKDEACNELDSAYDQILGQLFKMIKESDKWTIKSKRFSDANQSQT